MTTRKYSSRSQQTTLTSAVTSGATIIPVANATTLLGGATVSTGQTFTVVIDPDTALEEIVDITVVSGNNLTVTRDVDMAGAAAQDHSAGAVIRHMIIGRDLRESNLHIEATTAYNDGTSVHTLHGIASGEGDIVATDKAQTLTLKTLTTPTVNNATLSGTVTSTATITGGIVNPTTLQQGGTSVVLTGATSSITSAMITDGTIVNGDISASAAIAYSKLALTGTITSSDIANDTIVDGDINTAAAIAWTKIAPSSTVSATELGYLDGVTSAIQTQIDSKLATATASSTYAPLASPALTGTPTAPTATAGTSTTQVATTAYVGTAISNLVNGAPTTLDTLAEIATALNNTANFSDTVVLKTGSTMSGALAMGTNKITGMGTPTASTDAATKGYVDGVTIAPSNLTGPITSVGSATTIASQTGTGTKFVVDTSPTLVTPVLGVATATSINGTTIPSTKTLVVTTDKLSALAATTSAELAGVISDETGTGQLVFATLPTFGTSGIKLSGSTSGTTQILSAATAGTSIITLPAGTDTLVGKATTDTLTNKTLTSPVISTITNTGTLTLPTATGTIALTSDITVTASSTNTLTNKSLSDSTTFIVDSADTTKKLNIDVTGTTGITGTLTSTFTTAKTLTLPDATDTLVGKATTDTLTNKTLTSPVITTPKIAIGYTAKTAAYTVASGDEGYLFSMNNAATQQFNIPTDATFNFAIGTEIHFVWITGAGQPTIGATTPGTTTILSNAATAVTPKLRVANSAATAIKLSANNWLVIGDIA